MKKIYSLCQVPIQMHCYNKEKIRRKKKKIQHMYCKMVPAQEDFCNLMYMYLVCIYCKNRSDVNGPLSYDVAVFQ